MTPKQLRNRLFKRSRPFFRPLHVYDGTRYHKDIGFLWVSHQEQPFYVISKDATEEQFARRIEELAKVNEFLIAEDDNGALSKRGPVAVVGISSDGWKLEPHVEFMAWATPKNKLRCTVAFFQMMVHRNIGVCFVKSLVSSKNLFDACMKYFSQYSFNYIGKIPAGDERGDEYLYSARGKKHVKTDE